MDPSTIRQGNVSVIARIGEIDRTEEIRVKYHCKLAENGRSIEMIEERRDPPELVTPWSEEGIERRAAWWTREVEKDGAIFVSEAAGTLTGIAIMGPEKHGKCAELVAMFVDKDHRGLGLGRRLMEHLEDEARARGIETLYVGSNENERSLAFYQHMDFRIVCLMDASVVWIPGLETTITLVKRLVWELNAKA